MATELNGRGPDDAVIANEGQEWTTQMKRSEKKYQAGHGTGTCRGSSKTPAEIMENLEGPDQWGPDDRDTTEKLPDWTQVMHGAGKRQNHANTPAEGGKGWGKGSKLRQVITVMPQGDRRVFPDTQFNKNALYEKPVMLMTDQKVPAPFYDLTDMDMLNVVKMASYASFTMLQKILREYHGDLDSAPKPGNGQLFAPPTLRGPYCKHKKFIDKIGLFSQEKMPSLDTCHHRPQWIGPVAYVAT